MTPPLIPAPLETAFRRLRAAGVDYVVLRGYLPLSELSESLDIDVYVARQDRRKATAVLAHAGWLQRRDQVGRYPHRFYDNYEVPGRICSMLDVVYGLCYGEHLHGLTGAQRVLATAELLDGVRVPHPWVTLFTFALHVLLDKGKLSDANARRGRVLCETCDARPEGAALLDTEFGPAARDLAERFGRYVRRGPPEDFDRLRSDARGLACLRPRPMLARADNLVTRVRSRFTRPVRVAVLGMDGAGKTTVIQHVLSAPSSLPMRSAYLGYNQFTTRVFRWLLARIAALTSSGRGDGLAAKLLGKARDLWWPLELATRMRSAERGAAIVFYDRYPFPRYETDDRPTTLPGHVMATYERLWTALLPKPHILLFCDGEPEVVWARKREYSFEIFRHARERYLRLMREFPGERYVVDTTDGPVSSSAARVVEALRSSETLRRRLSAAPPTPQDPRS